MEPVGPAWHYQLSSSKLCAPTVVAALGPVQACLRFQASQWSVAETMHSHIRHSRRRTRTCRNGETKTGSNLSKPVNTYM